MSHARSPRWVLSFADLCLLLLGFFIILHARDGQSGAASASIRAAFGSRAAGLPVARYAAADLFQPGEAVFRPGADRAFVALGARARHVRIESAGTDGGTGRFDGWELAAARAAAIGRAVKRGGLAEDRIEIAIPPLGEGRREGQRVTVVG